MFHQLRPRGRRAGPAIVQYRQQSLIARGLIDREGGTLRDRDVERHDDVCIVCAYATAVCYPEGRSKIENQ